MSIDHNPDTVSALRAARDLVEHATRITLDKTALPWPDDANQAVAALAEMAAAQAQLTRQLAGHVLRLAKHPGVHHDQLPRDMGIGQAADMAVRCLQAAADQATVFGTLLDAAHQHLDHLGIHEGGTE